MNILTDLFERIGTVLSFFWDIICGFISPGGIIILGVIIFVIRGLNIKRF